MGTITSLCAGTVGLGAVGAEACEEAVSVVSTVSEEAAPVLEGGATGGYQLPQSNGLLGIETGPDHIIHPISKPLRNRSAMDKYW